MAFHHFISQLQHGQSLTADQSNAAFTELAKGNVGEDLAANFLMALKSKGETISEIVGAARAMRELMIPVDAPAGTIDVCGTGGDGKGSLNISTAVAIVVAACGVPVAKHGNRAISSSSGSIDVLEALSIRTSADPSYNANCIDRAGICFLAAPDFHPALTALAPLRKKLGTRTIFNLLGPLCNPASVTHQMVGVYDAKRLHPMAEALKQLGSTAAWVVHGGDGTDELSISGSSLVASLKDNIIHGFELPLPECLSANPADATRGGDAEHNATALRALLKGETGPYRDSVLLNAGAALMIAAKARDVTHGIMMAADAIDSGRACDVINVLISISKS